MRTLTRLAGIAALLACGISLPAQTPKKFPQREAQSPDAPLKDQRDPKAKFPRDPFDALYPPELVMEHQIELGLGDAERQALRQAVQQAQVKFTDL